MRVLIVGVGSRGDVAPYVGLGRRLHESGCDVAIATHDTLADLVRDAGLEWRRLSGDPRSLIRSRMEPGSEDAWRQAAIDFVTRVGDDVVDAAQLGADIILSAFAQAPLCSLVAAALDIPGMGVYLAPSVPTAEFLLPGARRAGDDGPLDNLTAGRQLMERARAFYTDVLPRLGRRLGLDQDAGERALDDRLGSAGWPICHGYSRAVVPRPTDWAENVDVVGYWWPPAPDRWQPAPELTDFLSAGPPPVFVGFGSMAVGRGQQLGPVVRAAIREAGVRAVVQSGWAEMSVEGDAVFQIGDAPHEWLFPRMAAAVHHAGAGTTGAALRAGIPAVTVPVLADQPFWAERVRHLGAGPDPIPFEDLSPQRLAAGIRASLDEPRHRERASELSRQVHREDGAAAVVRRIEALAS
jgi:sterol 3beta-glucosyltransferase